MTHPIHSADAERCRLSLCCRDDQHSDDCTAYKKVESEDHQSFGDLKDVFEALTGLSDLIHENSFKDDGGFAVRNCLGSFGLIRGRLADRAAAQVGANGAADEVLCGIVDRARDESDAWAESLSYEPNCTESNADFCRRIISAVAAAGAPAETPKQGFEAWWIGRDLPESLKPAFFMVWQAALEDGESGPYPAATIGAGEGKDALDAARYRKIKADNDDCEAETFCLFFDSKSGGLISIESEDMDAEIDAAMRSKSSPGEAG